MCVCVTPQDTADFSLVKSESGEIVTEDGRSRCPFNPEYKSTAIMAGKFQIKWSSLFLSDSRMRFFLTILAC